ncbi:hypothetical protein OG501_01515 [Streptomyces niveus]|uniref:hypothetical protein n=1 Tax=Streptomyces niveus TaxID=193462 RepID=UPI00386FBA82
MEAVLEGQLRERTGIGGQYGGGDPDLERCVGPRATVVIELARPVSDGSADSMVPV